MNIDCTKLDLALARAGLDINELCTKSGIPIITFSQVRRGIRKPHPKTVGRIAAALGVDPAELIETE